MIRVHSYSECGGHRQNEDAFAVRPHPQVSDGWLCVVADGQGGRAGGARAVQVASRTCVETACRFPHNRLLFPDAWLEILRDADRAVAHDPEAGLTTLVAFYLTEAYVCGASNGDSAAVVVQANRPAHILTDRQDKNPPIGSGDAAVMSFAATLKPPWTVLAMTDGVWKYAGWEVILQVVPEKNGADMIESSLDRARLPRSRLLQDDFTLIVLQPTSSSVDVTATVVADH